MSCYFYRKMNNLVGTVCLLMCFKKVVCGVVDRTSKSEEESSKIWENLFKSHDYANHANDVKNYLSKENNKISEDDKELIKNIEYLFPSIKANAANKDLINLKETKSVQTQDVTDRDIDLSMLESPKPNNIDPMTIQYMEDPSLANKYDETTTISELDDRFVSSKDLERAYVASVRFTNRSSKLI